MKSIKIILLSFSLAASLAVTSYAMSQNKNKNKNKTTTVSNYNLGDRSKIVKHNLKDNLEEIQLNKNKNKSKSQNKSKNKISTSKNKKSMKINTSKDAMEIDTSQEKNIPIKNKYNPTLNIYNKYSTSDSEKNSRKNIKDLLTKFVTLCPVDDTNTIKKDINEMSILDFNELQSILLDYYNFSVLFTTKYSPFITLGKTHTDYVVNKSKEYMTFYGIYYKFLTNIIKYVKILNNFCYKILFEDNFNKTIENIYFNNINTKSTENEELNEKTSKQLSDLSSDLQETFQNTQTEMTSTSQLWGNTFSKDKFTDNTFINEDTKYNEFEVTPNNYKDYEIPINLKDHIPHQYKINSHILAAVYKMELLKSQYYMKNLKDNPLKNKRKKNIAKNKNNESFFESYDKITKYANDIFKTYNSLRSFIILDKELSSIESSNNQNNNITSKIFPKDADSFNKALKKYTSDDTNNVYDLISFLIFESKKAERNNSDKTVLHDFINKSTFKNKYNIGSISALYNHISNNKESYDNLFKIYNVKDLKKFYSQINKNTESINTNSNPNKENDYKSLNEFLDSDAIDFLKNEEPKDEAYYTNRNLNLNIAQGLLNYYNRNWNLDKDIKRREHIQIRLKEFDTICKNLYNKDKIQENANLLNKDFNSLQSILLDYYKFLLFFSKYNNLIKMITTKTFKMQNYEDITNLIQRKSFVDNYKSFTDSIKEQVAKIKTFVNEMLTEKFEDPKNIDNITPETNLTQLLKMSEEILKLEPNFKEIFKIMQIDQITGNKVLKENMPLANIDYISKIPKIFGKKGQGRLHLHSINAAPPHYRVNLDILAAILKMEIVKWFPYFKKMPNTTVVNDQEKNTDINFTQSKKEMENYINTIYQFYDKLKSYMVWSMHKSLRFIRNKMIYNNNPKNIGTSIHIRKVVGKEKDFMKKIQAYIKDEDQFYTTLYLPPDKPNDSSEDPSEKPSTNKRKKEKKESSKNSSQQLSINLFKIYYDKRQNCVDKDRSQITLLAKHILKKQEIYDNFMNNNDPNISGMKLLDQFFSKLDPEYFSILSNKKLSNKNANTHNPIFVINKNPLLRKNKNNKKSIAKQFEETNSKINTSTQDTFTYNNYFNINSIFQKNYNNYLKNGEYPNITYAKLSDSDNEIENNILPSKNFNDTMDVDLQNLLDQNYNDNDNLIFQRKKKRKYTKKTNKNSDINQSKEDEKQTIQNNLYNFYRPKINPTTKQYQFKENEDQIDRINLIDPENNAHPWDLGFVSEFHNEQNIMSEPINNQNDIDNVNYIDNYNMNFLNNTSQNNLDLSVNSDNDLYKETTNNQYIQSQVTQNNNNLTQVNINTNQNQVTQNNNNQNDQNTFLNKKTSRKTK